MAIALSFCREAVLAPASALARVHARMRTQMDGHEDGGAGRGPDLLGAGGGMDVWNGRVGGQAGELAGSMAATF